MTVRHETAKTRPAPTTAAVSRTLQTQVEVKAERRVSIRLTSASTLTSMTLVDFVNTACEVMSQDAHTR